jgi:DMSO reductase anchor subunit
VGSSWISNEGLAGTLFFAFIVLYGILHFVSNEESSRWVIAGRRLIGLLAALCGLSLLFCQGMAYITVRPIPAWNTPLTLGFFVASSFVLGVVGMATFLAFWNIGIRDDQRRARIVFTLKSLAGAGTIALVFQLAVGGMWLIFLKTSLVNRAISESLYLLTGPLFEMTLVRAIIGLVLPLVLLGYAWMRMENQPRAASLVIVMSFICVLIGEVIARQLFFLVAVHI